MLAALCWRGRITRAEGLPLATRLLPRRNKGVGASRFMVLHDARDRGAGAGAASADAAALITTFHGHAGTSAISPPSDATVAAACRPFHTVFVVTSAA